MHHYRHVISQTSSLKGNRTRIRTCVRMPWANAVLFGYRHCKPQNCFFKKAVDSAGKGSNRDAILYLIHGVFLKKKKLFCLLLRFDAVLFLFLDWYHCCYFFVNYSVFKISSFVALQPFFFSTEQSWKCFKQSFAKLNNEMPKNVTIISNRSFVLWMTSFIRLNQIKSVK